jgi:hypothetical protein
LLLLLGTAAEVVRQELLGQAAAALYHVWWREGGAVDAQELGLEVGVFGEETF